MQIEVLPLSPSLYPAYYQLVQQTRWGNPMLPKKYNDSLWGDVVLQGGQVVGGWVGTLRGNHPLTRWLAKSVYFDSYPIFAAKDMEQQYAEMLDRRIRQHAATEHVVMFNLTHWVRGEQCIQLDEANPVASFCYDLSLPMETLYAKLDRLKRRTIKKAEQNNVEVRFYEKQEALPYIGELQRLRKETQTRAVHRNANSSMLLKSDAFFRDLMLNYNSTLGIVSFEEKVVAAVTFVESGQTVYAHMSGSDGEVNKQTGSGTYYYWKAVEYFKEKGRLLFDFGGCPVSPTADDPAYGIYTFKQGFGGDYITSTEGRIIISRWKYRILNFLLSQRKLLRLFSKKM